MQQVEILCNYNCSLGEKSDIAKMLMFVAESESLLVPKSIKRGRGMRLS